MEREMMAQVGLARSGNFGADRREAEWRCELHCTERDVRRLEARAGEPDLSAPREGRKSAGSGRGRARPPWRGHSVFPAL